MLFSILCVVFYALYYDNASTYLGEYLFIIINLCSFLIFLRLRVVLASLINIVYYYKIMCFLLNNDGFPALCYFMFPIIAAIFIICFV